MSQFFLTSEQILELQQIYEFFFNKSSGLKRKLSKFYVEFGLDENDSIYDILPPDVEEIIKANEILTFNEFLTHVNKKLSAPPLKEEIEEVFEMLEPEVLKNGEKVLFPSSIHKQLKKLGENINFSDLQQIIGTSTGILTKNDFIAAVLR